MFDTQTERTLELRSQAREQTHALMEELLREVGEGNPTDSQRSLLEKHRSDLAYYDEEIKTWSAQVAADREASKESERIRREANAFRGVGDVTEDGAPVYRTLGQVAIDQLLTSTNRHARAAVGSAGVTEDQIQRASIRLKSMDELQRTPATTLTSDIAGLSPPQHIAEIFQVINADRPLVDAARKVNLTSLTWTYPQVDATPVVAVQGTQKTEAGNTGLDVSMVTKTASTYLGGGNLSWQAISFSDPSAYDLWFQEIAADYALKTETDAATVVSSSAFLNNISSTISGTATFADFMTAVGSGYAEVYANSGRIANALIMAPDRYGYLLGLTSAAITQFVSVGQAGVGPLRVIVSRGLNAGEIIVGDMNGLLVAENAGAPVRMFVSEPAIAGVEVGLVGLFDAAVADDGAFAAITTAS
jgi:HK97 family phage major capsid protein